MLTINRKKIEGYYETEWQDIISPETLACLIELTCQTYQLNQPFITPCFIKEREPLRPKALGQI